VRLVIVKAHRLTSDGRAIRAEPLCQRSSWRDFCVNSELGDHFKIRPCPEGGAEAAPQLSINLTPPSPVRRQPYTVNRQPSA
jgi:hypothetical protein